MKKALENTLPDQIKNVMRNLMNNNMQAIYVPCKEDVCIAVPALIHKGDIITAGGSVTLEESNLFCLLQNGDYQLVDRYDTRLSDAEKKNRLLQAFQADAFICPANAITKNGEIYQVDGLSNRIAPLVFGPDNVIIIAGINKIVDNLEEAVYRVRTVTAPAIVRRRKLDAPCAKSGKCIAANSGNMAKGCMCDARRCCNFLVLGRQRVKGRIKIILIREALGLKQHFYADQRILGALPEHPFHLFCIKTLLSNHVSRKNKIRSVLNYEYAIFQCMYHESAYRSKTAL